MFSLVCFPEFNAVVNFVSVHSSSFAQYIPTVPPSDFTRYITSMISLALADNKVHLVNGLLDDVTVKL